MYYLDKHGSPFVKEIESGLKVTDFGNSRNLVLIMAWLLIEVDFFKRYDERKIEKIEKQVKE